MSKLATTWKGSGQNDGCDRKGRCVPNSGKGKRERTKATKSKEFKIVRTRAKFKRKQKAGLVEEGFWECSPRKRDYYY